VADHGSIRRVLILGHSGFIGRYLMAALVEADPKLPVFGRSMSDLDLTDVGVVERLADLATPETAVVVCAAIKKQLGDSLDAFQHNIAIIANLCRLFQSRPVGRVVFFSSAAVYGEDVHNLSITEDAPICPRSYYGLAKYTGECLMDKALERRDIRSLLILRPPLVYGPGDTSGSYGPVGFILKALRGEPVVLWGDGSEQRCFVYVEDVAQVVSRLLLSPCEGRVNIASGMSHTFQDVLQLVEKSFPGKIETIAKARTKTKVDNAFDNSKLIRMIGPFSFTALDTGIRKTIESLKEAGKTG
jgi:UDP-glucose 4-epimerase